MQTVAWERENRPNTNRHDWQWGKIGRIFMQLWRMTTIDRRVFWKLHQTHWSAHMTINDSRARPRQVTRFFIAAYIWRRQTLYYSTIMWKNCTSIYSWKKTASGVLKVPPGQFSPNSVQNVEAIVRGTTTCNIVVVAKIRIVAWTKDIVSLFAEMWNKRRNRH